MTEKSLADQLRTYYERKHPPPELLAELEELARTKSATPPTRRRRFLQAAAACLLVGLSGAALWSPWAAPVATEHPALDGFAQEIARHYLVCAAAPGTPATDIEQASAQLSKLDFQLAEPGCLREHNLEVREVRHCVFRNRVMAEVRLVDPHGRRALLCMSRLPGMPPGSREIKVDGLLVRIWSEAGLLMGLARPV